MPHDYDYVIVGAGSAGCVLARRLSEDGRRSVLLLEAGPPDTPKEIHIPAGFSKVLKTERDWGYRTVPQPHLGGRVHYWPRGKTLGGSSSVNAMIYMRGDRSDYDGWAALGNRGWAFDDVLPYFKRGEDNGRGASAHHGTGGPLAVSDLRDPHPLVRALVAAAREVGVPANDDFNGERQDGVGLVQVTQRNGKRCSAATGYLRPALARSNLEVRTGAHVTRVTFEGRRATGVRFRAHGREETASARHAVVLAGGAVNSPQLLLLSGIGPAAELRALGIDVVHDLPGVGRNLQDHPAVAVMVEARCPSLLAAETLPQLLAFLFRKKGMLTSNVAEACAFVRSDPSLALPDLQLHFAPVYFDTNLEAEPTDHAATVGPVLVCPESVGELRLASSDPTAPPLIDPRYLTDPDGRDLAALVAGVRWVRRILAAPAVADLCGTELQPGASVQREDELAAFVRAKVSTLYHPVGTCKMGTDPMAVVDPELRVHGVDGLRVIDASVMPRIVRGNTNAPTMMIAEKGADLLLGV